MRLGASVIIGGGLLFGLLADTPAQESSGSVSGEAIAPIERRIPPKGGITLEDEVREALENRVVDLSDRVWEIDFKEDVADVGALVKAVDLALRHGEFYKPEDVELATELLDLAEERHRLLDQEDKTPWAEETGLVVRGYQSKIDDSYQPFGLEIPENLDRSKPVPLLVWLHGRGDKVTDMHFIQRCRAKSQALGGMVADQKDAIILHPFGRHCVGWKHAGEIDVFEAIARVQEEYQIDPDRIALGGFSMGGAGAWHIGAHYRDQFCAVHAGAGFAETKEYNRLTPDQYPPAYEQTLWQLYDVPSYKRNFLNGPLLAYSGADDKQKQAADLMARELEKVDYELRHLIGEGMGHKYHPDSVAEIWTFLKESWEKGRDSSPNRIDWQTPTLRYPGYNWFQLQGLMEHWKPAIVAATWDQEKKEIQIDLENVSSFQLAGKEGSDLAGVLVRLGDQEVEIEDPGFAIEAAHLFLDETGKWTWGEPEGLRKRPGLQGPIDDAFLSRFVVVPPEEEIAIPELARWVDFEIDHFRARWKALMRGEVFEKKAGDLNSGDLREANLVLWGDPRSNPVIAEMIDSLPIEWEAEKFRFQGKEYASNRAVPSFIFPNPLNPNRYVVINSGLTFREGHDRTNSLQNPKLPDWAVIGFEEDPDELTPGSILDAGFFNESWK